MSAARQSQARRCMVVGYDRSSSAEVAAEWAARQVGPGGTLVLVHATRPLLTPPSALSTPEERRSFGQAVIDELLLEGGRRLLDVEVQTEVVDEDPVSALVEAAAAHGAEAIVIGSEHRSKLRAVIGTVTGELLKATHVPVIAVPYPAAEREQAVAHARQS